MRRHDGAAAAYVVDELDVVAVGVADERFVTGHDARDGSSVAVGSRTLSAA